MKQKTANNLRKVVAVFSACAITLNMSYLVNLPKGKFTLQVPYKVERIKKDKQKLVLKRG